MERRGEEEEEEEVQRPVAEGEGTQVDGRCFRLHLAMARPAPRERRGHTREKSDAFRITMGVSMTKAGPRFGEDLARRPRIPRQSEIHHRCDWPLEG